ncbi:DUF2142 domain-containing protein [Micromonospora sp. NPDC049175]|uniref:DUF2142 domain-containing protein n=1 Tax=unclassified Micromonospora TaxID=2617518 RepID=UPI0037217C29
MPFVAYFLLFAAWGLAVPYNGAPDEVAHLWQGYSVSSGQITPDLAANGAAEQVPLSLPPDACFARKLSVAADCASGKPGGDETLVLVDNSAGRYNPAYYLVTGWPLAISPDMAGVIAARLLNAALVAGLFGWATLVALSMRRRGALAGLIVALTPMTAHLGGAVNPNGVEIAAGAGLVMALIALLLEPDGAGRSRSAWWLAGVAGIVMLNVRSAGPLWFAIIVAVLLVPLGRSRYVALVRNRRTWWLAGVWAVAGLVGVAWTLWRRTQEIVPFPPDAPLGMDDILKYEFIRELPATLAELVGVMGWLDTSLPVVVHLAWWMALGVVVLLALAVGRPVDRWRVLGLAGLGLVVPILLEAFNVNEYGFISQGRYLLPMLVGVPILAGYLLADRIPFDLAPRLARLFAIVLLPMHLVALCFTMIRYQRGIPVDKPPSFNPIGGSWQPAVGSILPIAMAVGAAILFVVYYSIGLRGLGPDVIHEDGHSGDPAAPGRDLVDVASEPASGKTERPGAHDAPIPALPN